MREISNKDNNKGSTGLRTLDRGLAVLEVLALEPDGATMKHLSKSLGLNLSTCYHLVNTLLERGYVSKAPDHKVRLGSAVGNLYGAYTRHLRPERDLLPILTSLSHATGETAYLATWQEGEAVLRAVVDGPQHLRVSGLAPGVRGAAHCRASGKVMLAYLGEPDLTRFFETHELTQHTPRSITNPELLRAELAVIAVRGFAEDPGEFAQDICCIAAPYFDAGGTIVGAMTVSLPLSRTEASRSSVVEAVRGAGEAASRSLGYSGPYPPPPKSHS